MRATEVEQLLGQLAEKAEKAYNLYRFYSDLIELVENHDLALQVRREIDSSLPLQEIH